MALFNREINKRQVSNLQSFRIVLAPNKDALKHIDQIIHSAGQYEEGENLSVFDLTQSAEQDAKKGGRNTWPAWSPPTTTSWA